MNRPDLGRPARAAREGAGASGKWLTACFFENTGRATVMRYVTPISKAHNDVKRLDQ